MSLKHVTADTDIGNANLHSVVLTAGADAATLDIKTGGSSGTIVAKMKAAINSTESWTIGRDKGEPVAGLYLDVTGTTPSVTISYDPY